MKFPALKCLTQLHNKCAGVYATVLTPGEAGVGATPTLGALLRDIPASKSHTSRLPLP